MATPLKEIEGWKARDGAVVVRVDFLDAAGNVEESLPEVVAAEHRLKPEAFAYLETYAERPHFHSLDGFQKDGDEVYLFSGDRRIVVSPLWLKEQEQELRTYRAEVEPQLDELDRIFDAM